MTFPQKQSKRDVVSSKVHLLLDLIGCFSQEWPRRMVPLATWAEKSKFWGGFYVYPKNARKRAGQQQERSVRDACCTIENYWFCRLRFLVRSALKAYNVNIKMIRKHWLTLQRKTTANSFYTNIFSVHYGSTTFFFLAGNSSAVRTH